MNSHSLRVLVAEDNEANLFFLTTILKGAGHEVTGVIEGDQANELLMNSDFDLVLLDLFLPRMNGCEILRNIRRREMQTQKKVYVFAVTGSKTEVDQRDCELVDFDEWLFKPFTREELFKMINKYFY